MYLLPDKHKLSHKVAFYYHDMIGKLVVDGEKENKYFIKYKLKSDNERNMYENLSQDEFYEWFRKNRPQESSEFLAKTIVPAILSEFCQFVFTALECSEKGKLSVTYSLLRKPFKDLLFLLELMIYYFDSFILVIDDEKSFEKLDIARIKPKEKKISLML